MTYKIYLALGILLPLSGVFLINQHFKSGFLMLTLGGISAIIAIVIALLEISKSSHISFSRKVTWFIFFIISGLITGIVYLFKREKLNKPS